MGKEDRAFQPLGLDNSVAEVEMARIVHPESLEGLMAVAMTDPIEWDEIRSVLVDNKALLKEQGDNFGDRRSVMRRVLEMHIARGLQRAGERYPGLFRHAVTEAMETDRYKWTPSPLPGSTSVEIAQRFYNPKEHVDTRYPHYKPECTYGAVLEVEKIPVIMVPSVITTVDPTPVIFNELTIKRLSRPVRNLYNSPDFSYVVPAIVSDDVRNNTRFTNGLRHFGVVLQPINESLDTFLGNTADLQKRLTRAKTKSLVL